MQYGSRGGVFVCARETYDSLLRTIALDPEHFAGSDFGALWFTKTGGAVQAGEFCLEARLGSSRLRFREGRELKLDALRSLLGTLRELRHGVFDENLGIMRWKPKMWRQSASWGDALEQMFSQRQTSDVCHVVLFRNVSDTDQHRVIEQLTQLQESVRDMTGVKAMWFGTRVHVQARDGEWRGQLITDELREVVGMLFMRFESEAHLERFYSDRRHARIREEIYKIVGGEPVESMFEVMRSMPNEKRREKVFAALDMVTARYLPRLDFVEPRHIDAIVTRQPEPFP